MSLFDQADRQISAAIDQVFADPIVWRPKSVKRAGGRFTPGDTLSDPKRPVRGEDQASDPFVAVIAWRPGIIDPGTGAVENNGAVIGDVMLEMASELFRVPGGAFAFPRKGDQFEIPNLDGTTTVVELPRDISDDGSSRVQAWCTAPST